MEYLEKRILQGRTKKKFALCDKCNTPITFNSNKINIVRIDRKKGSRAKVINVYHEKCFKKL